jgi:hypothetical protein
MKQINEMLSIFLGRKVFRRDDLTEWQAEIKSLPERWSVAFLPEQIITERINIVWSKVSDHIDLIHLLISRIRKMQLVVDDETNKCIGICYLPFNCEDEDTCDYWFGGLPATIEQISELENRIQLKIPVVCSKLLGVHDGFGFLGNSGYGVLPTRLITRPKIHDEIICIASDPAGNDFCVDVKKLSCNALQTFEWDHEDQSLKPRGDFDVAVVKFLDSLLR